MPTTPAPVARFLQGRRFAVAGVSRNTSEAANHVFRKLVASGFDAVPINPRAADAEGVPCYPDVASVPGPLDGVVIVTAPDAAPEVVRQCAERGVKHVWFHRSIGQGGVSEDAVRACADLGIDAIVGGCPLMYCEPVDLPHRCMRWVLKWGGRVPG